MQRQDGLNRTANHWGAGDRIRLAGFPLCLTLSPEVAVVCQVCYLPTTGYHHGRSMEDPGIKQTTEQPRQGLDIAPATASPSTSNWPELAFASHYQTAIAIKDALETNEPADAMAGLKELIESLSRQARREMRRQLVRLMTHVITWQSQPERRSRSWVLTILNARDEIEEIREETPSVTETVVRGQWDRCFAKATRNAAHQMRRPSTVAVLSWHDVFEAEYRLPLTD